MQAYLWREIELTLTAVNSYTNPYTDLQPWIDFTHESGQRLRRPAFWDGGQMWRVRFAPTKPGGWRWQSYSDVADPGCGLVKASNVVSCGAGRGSACGVRSANIRSTGPGSDRRVFTWSVCEGALLAGRGSVHAPGR